MKHNRTLRRGLGVLFGLVLCLTLLTVSALADEPVTATETADFTEYSDYDKSLGLLTANGGEATWKDNTLTLNGVNFTTTAETAVKLPDGATIVLAAGTENTITSAYSVSEGEGEGEYESCGILAEGDLTIQGDGLLTATGGEAGSSYGICAEYGNADISGGTVIATGGTAEWNSCGIYAYGDLTISGAAEVTATGGAVTGEDAESCGIYANFENYVTIEDSEVDATGGKVTGEYAESYGIYGGNITISGEAADVTATGGAATGEYAESYGICAYTSITISAGSVEAAGGKADHASYGIYASWGGVTIEGGAVTATGGAADRYSDGIYASGDVAISGGTVTATGGAATGEDAESYGIYAGGGAAISGGTVTATGSAATGEGAESYGIYAGGGAAITGGTVKATGGEAGSSYGIFADYDYSDYDDIVTISGEDTDVTAKGGKATNNSYGIYAKTGLKISGGTVTAIGGEAKNEDYYTCSYGINTYDTVAIVDGAVTATGGEAGESCGICSCHGVAISGGSVTATGDTAEWNSCGIDAGDGDVTISDSANVTATGGTVTGEDAESCGIDAGDGVTIEGGTVTATGGAVTGEDAESFGILSNRWDEGSEDMVDGTITISGGHVIARTLAGENGKALNVQPDLSGYNGYYWRTSTKDPFTTGGGYSYNAAHTYVEFSDGCTYTITLDPNYKGGKPSTVFTGADGKLSELPTLTRKDSVFVGWSTAASGGEAVDLAKVYDRDTTLYAIWATKYGVTVNDVAVTSLNKDDVLSNGLVRYDPDTNTVYKTDGFLATLKVDGNGSTDVVLGGDTIAFLTVTGAKNVTGTDVLIAAWAKITCTGDVTFNNEKDGVGALTVEGARNVTVISSNPDRPAIQASATINCSGDVTISSANNIVVDGLLTVTAARDVTVTANSNSNSSAIGKAAIACSGDLTITNNGDGTAVSQGLTVTAARDVTVTSNSNSSACGAEVKITCSGDVTITANGGNMVMGAGSLTYQNAGGKHSYTVETGSDLENLTVYAVKEAGETFGPAALDASAVKITVAHTAGKWQSNSTQHWKVCTDCGIELERADHTFSGNTCTVCGYTKPSGGGGSTATYAITVETAKNGSVTASRQTASEGASVTLTVTPADGYALDTLTATDKNGDKVKLTDKGNGKYTFTMPARKVTVKAAFAKIEVEVENPFTDVSKDAYYFDAVLWAADKGVTGGTSASTFAPDAACTRAQAVTFLWRAAGSPAPKSRVNPFTDVAEGSYYETAVLWAVEQGITKGTTDTTFSPNATCTRAQIVTFLWRSQGSPAAGTGNPFADVAADAYYANAVLWAAENGITGGTTAATFSPASTCTRAQIVTFLFRCLGE